MTVTDINDNQLRKLIFDDERVIVKFTDPACPICKALSPSFRKLSVEPQYQSVTFARMSASENPVSSKEVKLTGTPFFAIYCKGTIQECGIVDTEDGIRAMLSRLLQPHRQEA
ncbi:thioredoxin family protein [Pontibacter sp. JH31]|uniref:Thioredoxin family protein n=1 Tax=Pontibacter aquaedesilientis TaxID=2766980 RepID=A0ABR7XL14_9BACT|nr:thioredoxin family protein [Pontibacter aquaedesilientis]MBD1398952.1 thioredoxin family protein [Pontibacter aquaedesilientis]